MSYLHDAKQLKDEFPEETKGFDIFQIERIWREHSQDLEATWLIPEREEVERVFSGFR